MGWMTRVAATASLCRRRMLSEPVSAQEEGGGRVRVLIVVVTGEGREVEDSFL